MQFAFEGGARRFSRPLPYNIPVLPEPPHLLPSIESILRSGALNKGEWTERLEREMARSVGVEEAVLVSSGIGALTLLIRAIAPKGPTLLPAFIFPPTVLAPMESGSEPLFADVSNETWMMGGREARGVRERPALVLGFHLFGCPAPADDLEKRCAEWGIPLVLDAAHALGSSLHGKKCGAFGLAEVFSLTPSKMATGGEGGVITTSDRFLARELRLLRNYGKVGNHRFEKRGMSARPTEIAACIATRSLALLDEERERRVALLDEYRAASEGLAGIVFHTPVKGGTTNGHECAVRVKESDFGLDRDQLCKLLGAEGVETRQSYRRPAYRTPFLPRQTPEGAFPVADLLSDEVFQLPVSRAVHRGDPSRIADLLDAAHQEAARLRPLLGEVHLS